MTEKKKQVKTKKETADKKQVGRKNKYDQLNIKSKLEWITEQIGEGKSEKSIIHSLGISVSTWENWKVDDTKNEFRESLSKGRQLQILTVQNQLLKKILGYELQEIEELQDDSGMVLQRKIKIKQHAPDTTSIIFWLKNRSPEEWKDRIENHQTGGFDFNVRLDDDDDI